MPSALNQWTDATTDLFSVTVWFQSSVRPEDLRIQSDHITNTEILVDGFSLQIIMGKRCSVLSIMQAYLLWTRKTVGDQIVERGTANEIIPGSLPKENTMKGFIIILDILYKIKRISILKNRVENLSCFFSV